MAGLIPRLKTNDDIARIAEAGNIISGIFSLLNTIDFAGMSTWELDEIVGREITRHGGRAAFETLRDFPFSCCISLNQEVAHGLPAKKRIIAEGDLVKIDIGVVRKGYFADACRTWLAGRGCERARVVQSAARDALAAGAGYMRPGCRIGDIGAAITAVAQARNVAVLTRCHGHGVGYALHEPPVVLNHGIPGTGFELREGLVLAIEPMLTCGRDDIIIEKNGWTITTADGMLSAHFEDTVAVTSDGPRVLTAEV